MRRKARSIFLISLAAFVVVISIYLLTAPRSRNEIAFIYRDQRSVGLYTIRDNGANREVLVSSITAPNWAKNLYSQLPAAQQSTIRPIFYHDQLRAPTWLGNTAAIAFHTRMVGQYCEWVSRVGSDGNGKEQIHCLSSQTRAEVFDWAPDGSKFAYATRERTTTSIKVVAADGSAVSHRTLTGNIRGLSWSTDSSRIAVTSDRQPKLLIYQESVPPIEIATDFDPLSRPTWSHDGQHIAFFCAGLTQIDICIISEDGRFQHQRSFETTFPYIKKGLTWSPTGEYLAFFGIQHGGANDIFIMAPFSDELHQLTTHPGADTFPEWSPDGGRLVFSSNRDGNWELYTIQVDGQALTRLTDTPGDEIEPSWRSHTP